jgi:sigma-B regulation protein RsbU (phosphoserine phosphatase)
MANLQATLRAQTLTTAATCERLMHANRLLYRSTDPEKFATLFYGILDARKNELCFCNAGHENPILFSASGELERLATGGLVLGIMDDFRFQERMVSLNPGDMLVIFSDGVTEAMNDKEELFGEHRLIDIVREGQKYRSADLIDRIVENVKRHAGDVPQVDDITLVVVRRLEGEPAE